MTNVSRVTTPAFLLRLLSEKGRITPSKEELFEQRISFVIGSLDSNSDVTREQVRKKLAEDAGQTSDTV